MADLDKYDLVDLNSAVESYFTDITSGKSPVENPKGYILGGQGGAGKSTIHNIVKEKEPNTVVINGDEFRELHPNFEKIADVYGEEAANHTQSFANAVANALVEKLSNDGYNIIIEGTCRRADVPTKSCNDLKEKGYTVELSVMCTDKETAWNSTIDRYNEMKAQGMFARAVPREKYEETVKALSGNIDILYQEKIFDEITLYNRNRDCLYRMTDTPELSPGNIVDNVLNNTTEVQEMDKDYENEFDERTTYLNYLTKLIKQEFGEDMTCKVRWSDNLKLNAEDIVDIKKALENYDVSLGKSIQETIEETVEHKLMDSPIFNDLLNEENYKFQKIEAKLYNIFCDDKNIIQAYENIDYDDLKEAGYKGIDLNVHELLSHTELRLIVTFATEEEKKHNESSIYTSAGYHHSFYDNDIVCDLPEFICDDNQDDTYRLKLLDNALTYIIHQQGHTVEDFYKHKNTEFINTSFYELAYSADEHYGGKLTALVQVNAADIGKFADKINSEDGFLQLDKNTSIGLGYGFDIKLEKDLVIPTSMVDSVQIDGTSKSFSLSNKIFYNLTQSYGIDVDEDIDNNSEQCFSMMKEKWGETINVGKAFTAEQPLLKQEDLRQTLKEFRAEIEKNTQKQEQSRGR
jgi:UDP-N-acetylglucosamine kinase